MEFTGLLTSESIENAFIVGLLLTGSMEQAEQAVLESVRCSCPETMSGESLFRRVIRSAIDTEAPCPDQGRRDLKKASSILPFELANVLALSPGLRHCYVLRILVALPREVCGWLLNLEPAQLNQRTQEAMLALASMHRPTSRGASRQLPARTMVKATARPGLYLVHSLSMTAS